MNERHWDWVVIAGMWLTVLAMAVMTHERLRQVERINEYQEEIEREQESIGADGGEGVQALPAPPRLRSL